MPPEPDRAQRARDERLAWIIVGCSAAATVVLLIAGLVALRGPVGRWTKTLAAANASAPAVQRDDEVGKSPPDADDAETNLAGDGVAELPAVGGEVRKRDSDEQDRNEQDGDDAASVRRGQGPHERHDTPPVRQPGPIA